MQTLKQTIKLGDLCRALDVKARLARYALERGFVPDGIYESPGSGEHRDFEPHQAFWLAIVLKVKAAGLQTSLAAKIADYADHSLRAMAQGRGWDWRFSPRGGHFATAHQYIAEVADLEYCRLVSDSRPGHKGWHALPWHRLRQPGVPVKEVRPCVTLQIDLTEIARRLGAAFASADA